MSPVGDLEFAWRVAERAGVVLMDRFGRLERVDRKRAKDVVTEADHLSEDLIIDAIRKHGPGDGILAEESGSHPPSSGRAQAAGRGRLWIVDPLDGTVNYANGIPFFCVSIALVVDGRATVGIVHDPTRGETFAASVEGPALLHDRADPQGRPIAVSAKDRLDDLVVALAISGRAVATRVQAVRAAVRVSRDMGAAALEIAYVADGRFDAVIQSGGLSAWDIAAAGLIAERAGATVTDASGGPWLEIGRGASANGILAAPPGHHPALLALSLPRGIGT
ncbi:MAG: inositol monophosphatase family protein [Candidatus Limnocylindrales bacterium]